MDRRKRVLNFSEAAVDRMLAEYAAENGYRISLKMRLRDVIDVNDLPYLADRAGAIDDVTQGTVRSQPYVEFVAAGTDP